MTPRTDDSRQAGPGTASKSHPDDAAALIAFWTEAGPARWFKKDDAFDQAFRDRFLALHEAAARGELAHWSDTAEGALALVLLLDQFPRNAFRGTARMYATDARARAVADAAVTRGFDHRVEPSLQAFFYLPFEHSESIADQERSVMHFQRLGGRHLEFAEQHRDIVRRFGRFPHRNPILGRTTTADEQRFLDEGGFAG
jgi:uncharacterized protein (DUF924 family)